MSEEQATIDANARWLRDQRQFFDISTIKLAERAREVARQLGDEIKLSQQLISKFENGGMKTSSRWLGYVQIVFLQICREKRLNDAEVWDLKLPAAQDRFFEEQRRRLKLNNPFAELLGKEDYASPASPEQPLSFKERAVLQGLRLLAHPDFELVTQLIERLQEPRAVYRAQDAQPEATIHDRKQDYRGKPELKGWGE